MFKRIRKFIDEILVKPASPECLDQIERILTRPTTEEDKRQAEASRLKLLEDERTPLIGVQRAYDWPDPPI